MERIRVDENGYLLIEGVKVCQVRGDTVAFYDKDRRRRTHRGKDTVEGNVLDIVKAIASYSAIAK